MYNIKSYITRISSYSYVKLKINDWAHIRQDFPKRLKKRILFVNFDPYTPREITIIISNITYIFETLDIPEYLPILIPKIGHNITQLMKYS